MPYAFDKPGVYVIRVVGGLDAGWSQYLGGLTISNAGIPNEDSKPITELTGSLPDQAALFGVLTTLYDRGYALLHVEYVEDTEI